MPACAYAKTMRLASSIIASSDGMIGMNSVRNWWRKVSPFTNRPATAKIEKFVNVATTENVDDGKCEGAVVDGRAGRFGHGVHGQPAGEREGGEGREVRGSPHEARAGPQRVDQDRQRPERCSLRRAEKRGSQEQSEERAGDARLADLDVDQIGCDDEGSHHDEDLDAPDAHRSHVDADRQGDQADGQTQGTDNALTWHRTVIGIALDHVRRVSMGGDECSSPAVLRRSRLVLPSHVCPLIQHLTAAASPWTHGVA